MGNAVVVIAVAVVVVIVIVVVVDIIDDRSQFDGTSRLAKV